MTPRLKELLELMRQHAGFRDLLEAVEPPKPQPYRPRNGDDQYEDWIHRSGRLVQHSAWIEFLTEAQSPDGDNNSHKEKS